MSDLKKNWEKDQKAAMLLRRLKQERRDLESIAMDHRAHEMKVTREVLINEILDEAKDRIKRDCDAERSEREAREERDCRRTETRKQFDAEYALAKRRQLLRETDPELKELNRRLQAQYINRTLEVQMLEKKLTRVHNENREKINLDVLDEPLQLNDNKISKHELVRQYDFRRDLQDQMIEKQLKKQKDYEGFLQERVEMDETVKRIHKEDKAAYDAKLATMERLRLEMESFEKTQDDWRAKHKEAVFLEDKKLKEVNDSAEKEEERRRKEKQKKLDEKDQRALQIACIKFERESRIAQQEAMVAELDALQIKDKQSKQRKQDFQDSLKMRASLRETLLGQIAERKVALKKDAAVDAALHHRLLEDTAAEALLEQKTKEKRHLRDLKFRAEANELVDEHRAQRAKETVALIEEEKQIVANEKAENDFIEQERILMIKEHAPKLGSFFPKGVLRASDIPFLGPELCAELGVKAPEPK